MHEGHQSDLAIITKENSRRHSGRKRKMREAERYVSRFSVNPKSTEGEREDEEDSLYATGLLNFFFGLSSVEVSAGREGTIQLINCFLCATSSVRFRSINLEKTTERNTDGEQKKNNRARVGNNRRASECTLSYKRARTHIFIIKGELLARTKEMDPPHSVSTRLLTFQRAARAITPSGPFSSKRLLFLHNLLTFRREIF